MGVPRELAEHNARLKADAAAGDATGDEVVIACDTVVDVDGIPFGKPESAEDAYTMLALLRGRVHNVIGGLVVSQPSTGLVETRVVSTMVRFRDFPEELLMRYLTGDEWQGRAGGYAIQGTGAAMVQGIGGCYQNVVGLPVAALLGVLEETEGWDTLARRAV